MCRQIQALMHLKYLESLSVAVSATPLATSMIMAIADSCSAGISPLKHFFTALQGRTDLNRPISCVLGNNSNREDVSLTIAIDRSSAQRMHRQAAVAQSHSSTKQENHLSAVDQDSVLPDVCCINLLDKC